MTTVAERPRLRYLSGRRVPPDYWEPNNSEARVLEFVLEVQKCRGFFPTYKMIAEYMDCSIGGVANQLAGLRYKGYLPRKSK